MEKLMDACRDRLPPGVTEEDLLRCESIVKESKVLNNTTDIAMKILAIIYSKGGDYSDSTIRSFAHAYQEQME